MHRRYPDQAAFSITDESDFRTSPLITMVEPGAHHPWFGKDIGFCRAVGQRLERAAPPEGR
jgi:hypothetical protein